MKFTAKQLSDILFQNDNRVTKNITDTKTSALQHFRDRASHIWNDLKGLSRNPEFKWKDKIALPFNIASNPRNDLAVRHERSLKHAVTELQALGFSTLQINRLCKKVRQFARLKLSNYARNSGKLHSDIQDQDLAFLGVIGQMQTIGEQQVIPETFSLTDALNDDDNHCFNEDDLYKRFSQNLQFYLLSEPELSEPENAPYKCARPIAQKLTA